MDINDITDKEEFYTVIINELKAYGVRYQKEKKKKIPKNSFGKNIFRTHLHLLSLTEVILANGKVVQIPKIVGEACNRILEQVETEGIFRKAGSFMRQKEIRISLEAGIALGKTHHVVDVANVVKYFFRELPEPLIPQSIQDTLLGSLLLVANSVRAILLACLLLPPLTINTLSFFMQFLNTVSLSEKYNKMSIENLAIIFTPGLMPFPNVNSPRFSNHVKIIRILIENANTVGAIPMRIQLRLQENLRQLALKEKCDHHIGQQKPASEKKKKRRSDIFHGLRKIVGSAIGSSDFLEDTPNENKTHSSLSKSEKNLKKDGEGFITATPCLKSCTKRRLVDPVSGFTVKKKETKKLRLSFGGGRQIENTSFNPVVTSMERRWSIVGSGWSKDKSKNAQSMKYVKCSNYNFDSEASDEKKVDVNSNLNLNFKENCQLPKCGCIGESVEDSDDNRCYTQVSKTEYQEINIKRVSDSNSTEQVQTQYERTVTKTEAPALPAAEQLAKCLSRGLNIRHSINQRVKRSPSTRKRGTICRRSQDRTLLSRNYSCHLRSSNDAPSIKPISLLEVKNTQNYSNPILFSDKNIQKTLNHSTSVPSPRKRLKNSQASIVSSELLNEHWMSGDDFFIDTQAKELNDKIMLVDNFSTPIRCDLNINAEKTPMLPPKSLPKKKSNTRTPLHLAKTSSMTRKLLYINRVAVSTLESEEICGRASIARLRAQNAGMVLAKAKLFDGLENNKIKEKTASASKQRQRGNSSTSSQKHLLKSIATHDKLIKHPLYWDIAINSSTKADTLNTLNHSRISKSPRGIKKIGSS